MSKFVTLDGNEAAAHIAYALSEIAAIYPITPSSPMAGKTDAWSARGKKNLFGQTVSLIEMQSEAGAIGAVHGALQSGALATTFTSSQGLMLMIPVLHRIAGERLPAVLHIASRTVGTHAMSIFGDHSDVMNCRQTGFAMLCSGSVQETMDLAGVAHLAAIRSRVPFMHFFDGFRTSHQIDKVEELPYEVLANLLDKDALQAFRDSALNPEHPTLRNTVQNGDIYFQVREANNPFYEALPAVVEDYLCKINKATGRDYHLFNYYGASDATEVVIAMGSVSGAASEAVDYLNAHGRKVGFIQVHLFRPFSCQALLAAIPQTVKAIAVLDRCKEMGSAGEPLYQDVCTAFTGSKRNVRILGGRYGLSSKDTSPEQIVATFDNLLAATPINSFTIGINDDVTHRSLPLPVCPGIGDADMVSCKFWGLGSDGTVGANHNTVKIINDKTNYYAQAYFEYDTKKSFGITKSHLRFGPKPIRSAYYVKQADFVACHNQTYLGKYEMVEELKDGGTFLLNCTWKPEELSSKLPAAVRAELAKKHAHFYIINATAIAEELGLGNRINTVLQAAFFALAGILPIEEALNYMKDAARQSYFTKGDAVVAQNLAAIERGANSVIAVPIPAEWANATEQTVEADVPAVIKNILFPIISQKGDDLPVSAFCGYEDGHIDMGLTAYEKRGIAMHIPQWDAQKCLQCNRCALVCPHAVIRPYLLQADEVAAAPEGFITVPAKGAQEFSYSLQISAYDCTGCGSCAAVCPAKDKALTMAPALLTKEQSECWEYGLSLSDKGDRFNPYTVKGSQFRQPLVEFSGACAGCGETPYAKLLTQLFGDRVYWANATGCSQAWGAPMPSIPYTVNKRGHGVAWTNSLFENNAELTLGLFLGVRQQREGQKMKIEALLEAGCSDTVRTAALDWLATYDDFQASRQTSDALIAALQADGSNAAKEILKRADQLAKKCFWMYGGDGWAYDIGFGGLDHVIATGEDINVFVVDTEVYSNTGGQSSKATPLGAVAQFADSGKRTRKKDLCSIFRTYGNVYVAQVAMGADPNQLLKAIREAEAHKGPSLIVAYTPCISHGIKAGMNNVQEEMKRAVDAGYWLLYRYDPKRDTPLMLDSKAPSLDYQSFLEGEVRYASLKRTFPENAARYFSTAAKEAQERYEKYRAMAENTKQE